jgi:hypothetical protein
MLGLLAWYRDTGSPAARKLLDRQVDGLMRIARDSGDYVSFPKYEYDGKSYVDEPAGKDAPIWYGGRLILPMVEYWQLSGREDVKAFLEKLVRYSVEVSHFIKPDGEVEHGETWWGHLHGTMDMTAGIAEFGRLTQRPELVAWAKRVYDWIGRTQTTRYGFVADVSGGSICESCGIASRFRLGLSLYRAGAVEPFAEMDRHLRNQLMENQFSDMSFMGPMETDKPRTQRAVYQGIDRMIRGTFQCWGTANDLLGNDDIEGCGAGGGVQGLALAWDAQSEWRETPDGKELRIHLLFNRTIRAKPESLFTSGPVAARLWSYLPQEGRVRLEAQVAIPQLTLRMPDGADLTKLRVQRWVTGKSGSKGNSRPEVHGAYVRIPRVSPGETIEVLFPLREYETVEQAAGKEYRVTWKGSSVLSLSPAGKRVPLYTHRSGLTEAEAPLCAPRYP